MDPNYLSTWLQQTQNAGPPQTPETHQDTRSASARIGMEVDQPLDLRVMPSSPLDLTVSKPPNKIDQPGELQQTEHRPFFSQRDPLAHGATAQPPRHQSQAPKFPSNLPNLVPYSSNKKLHCTFCGYQCDLLFKEEFNRHVAKHVTPPHQYVCTHCRVSLSDQASLQEHLLGHGLLYQHVCLLCSVAFSSQTVYWAHISEVHKVSLPTRSARGSQPDSRQGNPLPMAGPMHSHGISSTMSMNARSSPSSNGSSCVTLQSPGSTGRSAASASPQRTCMSLGQSIAKQIEEAISHKVAGGKTPSMSDLLFMKSEDSGPATTRSPVNLMSLLDKVVEESVKTAHGIPSQKPDLKFMVTFSEDEDDNVNECDSTVTSGSAQVSTSEAKHHGKEIREDDGEEAVTSTERPVDGQANK